MGWVKFSGMVRSGQSRSLGQMCPPKLLHTGVKQHSPGDAVWQGTELAEVTMAGHVPTTHSSLPGHGTAWGCMQLKNPKTSPSKLPLASASSTKRKSHAKGYTNTM